MDSFIPLFETLNWATSLEQYIRARWPSELSGSERWYDSIPYGQTGRDPREELAFQVQLSDYGLALRQEGGGVTRAWKPGAAPDEWRY